MSTRTTDQPSGSPARYLALFSYAPFPIFLIDADTRRILDANPSACQLYGYSREEMLELTNADMSAEPNRTSAAVDHRLDKVPVRFHRKKDGSVFPVEISATYFSESGRDIHVAFIHDISDRISLEDRETDLWTQIRHLARLSDLGTLATSLAHDMAQPITAIVNYASAMERLAVTRRLDLESVSQLAGRVRSEALNADGIIRGVRHLIARDDGETVPCDIGEIIGHVAMLFDGAAVARAVRIEVAATDGIPMVQINPVQIRQVLVNLIQNGLDALDESSAPRREIEILAQPDDSGMASVTVRDTGPGIDPGIRENLFKPFRTTKKNGMGVGLHIAQTIVENHGGVIRAESEPGQGATFTFTVPLAV